MSSPLFADRAEAGRRLAVAVAPRVAGARLVVLGLPRGGVPVAGEIAAALGAPLDVIVVRKLGAPHQPELAVGAVGEGGLVLVDEDTLAALGLDAASVAEVEWRERAELARRLAALRAVRPAVPLAGCTAIVVDDGLATGATARAACRVARAHGAARVLLAIPVAPAEAVTGFAAADEVVCLATPQPFRAVGIHYRDFSPTSEGEVIALLTAAARADQGRSGEGGVGSGEHH
jgi:putative phosphoribosyl transferase